MRRLRAWKPVAELAGRRQRAGSSEEVRTLIVFPLMVSITIAKTRDGWRLAIHLAMMI